ncbi:hypothetical protein RCL_jg20165.t1 [Rhizophagus clarus]|uniref:Uncharacterized protein n=1 Tax=Rhizophagus clarus TaxID=94130 RepID=A0A8H3QE41_9GLOM|nr:hypothetical protein RCL_jg20165.t1 [Rhizophagus clarus]
MSHKEYDNAFIYGAYSDSSPSFSDAEEASSSISMDVETTLADGSVAPPRNKNLVNFGDSHLITLPIIPELRISQSGASSKSPIMPEMRLHITESEMININIENANDDTTIPLQPSGSDNTTPKDIKKKKTVDKSVKKIYVDTTIPVWGDPILMTMKKQRKYPMLQIKICLLTFAFAFFEQKYDNTPLAISLYISSLETGHYIKGKEENSFVYILMTYLKNLVSGYSQLIFGNLPIKAIKQFETGGKASIVVFFEKYEDLLLPPLKQKNPRIPLVHLRSPKLMTLLRRPKILVSLKLTQLILNLTRTRRRL